MGTRTATYTAILLGAAGIALPLHAEVIISSAATRNMSCSSGVCAPTAKDAVLNAGDLETLIASGNVEVTTTGSGVQANDIHVDAALGWSASSTLALDAYDSITVNKAVTVSGHGGLSLTTNNGGSGGILLFGTKGDIAFSDLSSALTINSAAYTLISTLPALASAIAADPAGAYALAADYDASADGTYHAAPITTTFTGNFNGLGNTISHLQIAGASPIMDLGLFADVGTSGTVASLKLTAADIQEVA